MGYNKLLLVCVFIFISIVTINTSYSQNNYDDSPFGIFGPYEVLLDTQQFMSKQEINDCLLDIGVPWLQEMPNGIGDIPDNILIYSRVNIQKNLDENQLRTNIANQLQGGIDNIKYWEVSTEPNFNDSWGWKSDPAGYANVLRISYETIHEQCNDCYVVNGGLVTRIENEEESAEWLRSVMDANNGVAYFDGFEFKLHEFTASEYQVLKSFMEAYGAVLADYDVDIYQIPVFIETSTYNGDPGMFTGDLPAQSESEQAGCFLKLYVYNIEAGIDRIFHMYVLERNNFAGNPSSIFNFTGLVNNPFNADGHSHKKLVYYTYKLMIEKFEGSDWDNIEKIIDGEDNVYLFKLSKKDTDESVYAAWWDYFNEPGYTAGATRSISLHGIRGNVVTVTDVVPDCEDGSHVSDYQTAFTAIQCPVINGAASITLGEDPVLIEALSHGDDAWKKAYGILFSNPSDLERFRDFRDSILKKTGEGKIIVDLLYKNSRKALGVLLKHPELTMRASRQIKAHKDTVCHTLNGNIGVIHNSDELIAFFEAYAVKSPPPLKILVNMIKKKMSAAQKQKKLFLGFLLED